MRKLEPPLLSPKFTEALLFTTELHARQRRKGSRVPYISHLLAVTALVLQDGGDETTVIAALLHDAVEDQGGMQTLAEIENRFGKKVAEIVLACSDTTETPKPPWRERKLAYLKHLETAPPEVLRVSLADKLHNARSILRDLHIQGEAIWDKFNGGKQGTLWYYRSLYEFFSARQLGFMAEELGRVLAEIEEITGEA
ncbi:MAG: HD domain-containing protein [Anaerolineales bacterium]|nr:HD domain-containing protein [Anaerolineales bacterium]